MGVLEELKAKHPWHNIPPYGDCVVVNAAEWKAEWEQQLKLQNVKPVSTTFKGQPVYLLSLKGIPREVYERRNAPAPPPTPSSESDSIRVMPGIKVDWQPEEDEQLTKLWNKKVSTPKMAKYFPNRTPEAIRDRATSLIRQGKIQPRWHRKSSKKRQEKVEEKPKPKVPEKSPESTPRGPGDEGMKTVEDALNRLKKLLQESTFEFHDSAKPVCFKWYCSNCEVKGQAKTRHVWKTCPFCGESLVVWDVE